jgi:tetratricopeptide (TPR) repeat protein
LLTQTKLINKKLKKNLYLRFNYIICYRIISFNTMAACMPCGNSKCTNANKNTDMKLCSRCKKVGYCNKDCQVDDWSAHKLVCINALSSKQLNQCNVPIGGITRNIIKDVPVTAYSAANKLLSEGKGQEAIPLLKMCTSVCKLPGVNIALEEQSKIFASSAVAHMMIDQNKKAERALRKAILLNPKNAGALNTLSAIYRATGKFDLAIKLIERAIYISPNQPEFILNYALLLKDTGKVEETEVLLRHLIQNHMNFMKEKGII